MSSKNTINTLANIPYDYRSSNIPAKTSTIILYYVTIEN